MGRLMAGLMLAAVASALATSAQANDEFNTRYLQVNNRCKYPVRLLVHHRDSRNPHHTHAWYRFEAFEKARLKGVDNTLRQIEGESVYFFAETVGDVPNARALQWAGDDATTTWSDVTYRLRRAALFVNESSDLEFRLECTNN